MIHIPCGCDPPQMLDRPSTWRYMSATGSGFRFVQDATGEVIIRRLSFAGIATRVPALLDAMSP